MLRRASGCLLLLLALPATPAAGELYAERIGAANAAARRVGGPDAIAGVGDWALGNGTLCAALADPSHETVLATSGGVLVDLGHCGRGDDRFIQLQPLLNLSRGETPPVTEVRAERDAETARLVTRGEAEGASFETRYELSLARPTALRVRTQVDGREGGTRIFLFGDVILNGRAALAPFTLHTGDLGRSSGHTHPDVDPDSYRSLLGGLRSGDLQVLVGAERGSPGIAYGVRLVDAHHVGRDGRARAVPSLALTGEDFSLLGVLANPLWLGDPDRIGLLALAQTVFMDVEEGERLVFEREVLVGRRGDVASVTDQVWPDATRVSGRVDDPEARIEVALVEGAPFTWLRPDPDGRFVFRAPPGEYTVTASTPDGRRDEHRRRLADTAASLEPFRLGAPARVRLPRGQPMRLVFRGLEGTPDPELGADRPRLRFGDRVVPPHRQGPDVSLAGRAGDPEAVVLRPGRYRVYATRGPEFDVSVAELSLEAGSETLLDIAPPPRALETPGWIAADFHVHAEPSDDSAMPLRERVASFVAQGGEVLVATDHDRVTDFAPLLRELDLTGQVASMVGTELTATVQGPENPHTSGHSNLFPVPRDPIGYRDGTLDHEGRRIRSVIAELRALGGERIWQLNHPRSGSGSPGSLHYFEHLSVAGEPFDPARPLGDERNRPLVAPDPETGVRDLDFDAIELMNGAPMSYYRAVRADWFSLLLQGELRTATANSDTHVVEEIAALPRTYVRMADDDPGAFDEAELVAALRAARAWGSTGPILDARLGEAGPGERHAGASGRLRVEVRAAAWVPVSQLRVYVNGALADAREIAPGGSAELALRFDADAFVTVEVEGEPGEIYAAVAPGYTPFAFTNPIFVDADGDGRWTPPGLPDPLPVTITRRRDR